MPRKYSTATKNASESDFLDPRVIQAETASDHRRELNRLSDIAFAFLTATDGDKAEGEAMLDNFIDLIFEAGVLSTWRYRILLANIREGL